MKKVIISVFAAFALVGCVKEMPHGQNDSSEVTVERGPLVPMKAIITDSDSQTRVSVDEQTGKLSWSEGDQVAVVLSDGTNYSLDADTYTINHETGILKIPDNSAYVIYPVLQEMKLTETKLELQLPSTHNVATPADAFDNALMKGVVNGDRVEFKNLLGFFKVPLTGEGKLKSAVLRTICRTTTDFHPVSKSATLDLSYDATTAEGSIKMATDNHAFAWVRYNFSGDVDLSSNPSVYFAVPAGEYENMGIVLVTDKGSNAIYAANAHEVNRSSVKPVSASAINLSSHTPASPESLVGTTGDSQEDYANCYIVPPTAGSYEFDCKLADGTDLKGGVTAEIKWAEQAGMINDLCYDSESNKISFKTNGKEGNALVVLTDNTDNWQTNVWTWHIWITDAPKVLKLNGATTSSNEYYVMDRVLGATWAPSSTIAQTSTKTWGENNTNTAPMNNTISSADATDACGVYFQYQNRNPLPRIRDIDDKGKEDISTMLNSRCDVMYGTTQYGQYWTTSSLWADAHEDAHKNNQYVHNGILYPNYQYSVTYNKNDLGWINVNLENSAELTATQAAPSVKLGDKQFRFWNSIPETEHGQIMKGKTTHDPCPPGYIIETSEELKDYLDSRKTEVGFARATADDVTNYSAGFRFYGMYLNQAKTQDAQDIALYFPCGSYRKDCVPQRFTTEYGNMGYIYAVNASETKNNSFTFSSVSYHRGFAEHYGASNGKTIDWPVWVNTKQNHSRAYHVRCRRGKF